MFKTDMKKEEIEKRFKEKVSIEGGCWRWNGVFQPNGYPILNLRVVPGKWRSNYAHRIGYWLVNGDFDPNLHCCHRCDHPWCVNTDHIFLGTDADNHRDKINKGRQPRGTQTHNHKLNDEIVRKIRDGTLCPSRALNRELGLSSQSSHLYRIRKGKYWTHI